MNIISDSCLPPGYLLLVTSLFKSFVHFEVFLFFFFHCGVYDVNVGMWSLSDVLCGITQSKLQLVFSFLTLHRAQFVIW